MSYSRNHFGGLLAEMMESAGQTASDASLPVTVRSLENDELQALLVILLREWRERIATSQDNCRMPARLNA